MAIYKGASMRIKLSDDGGTTYKEIMHEISFEFGASREEIPLASKDDESLKVPGSNSFTLQGNAFGDVDATAAQKDLKAMLDWQYNKSTENVQIATGDNAGDLIISSTSVYLKDITLTANINEGLQYSFAIMINNASYSTVS